MRFLHTSDWHIGKRLEGRERLNEQREVLMEIAQICSREAVDVVLVAGDIFDTAMPSGEAEALFYDALTAISDGGKRAIVCIAGNHDDVDRVTAADKLAERQGIYLCGGAGHVVLEKGGERAVIAMLAYPSDTRMSAYNIAADLPFGERVRSWFNIGADAFDAASINVAVSHLFARGGSAGGDEREIELGGARLVDRACLPRCQYTALGHLHRAQIIDSQMNVRYSGSILPYSFDDVGDKYIIVFDCCAGAEAVVRQIALQSGKKLVSLTAESYASALQLLAPYKDAFTCLTLNTSEPLSDSENKTLKENFPNLLKINLNLPKGADEPQAASVRSLSRTELFTRFYERESGTLPPPEILKLFLEIMGEEA